MFFFNKFLCLNTWFYNEKKLVILVMIIYNIAKTRVRIDYELVAGVKVRYIKSLCCLPFILVVVYVITVMAREVLNQMLYSDDVVLMTETTKLLLLAHLINRQDVVFDE